jgi:hypothetical protein
MLAVLIEFITTALTARRFRCDFTATSSVSCNRRCGAARGAGFAVLTAFMTTVLAAIRFVLLGMLAVLIEFITTALTALRFRCDFTATSYVSAVLGRLGASVRFSCDRRRGAVRGAGYGGLMRHCLFCGEMLILRITVKIRRNVLIVILFCWLKISVVYFVRWLMVGV